MEDIYITEIDRFNIEWDQIKTSVDVNEGVANFDYVTNTTGTFTLTAVYDETPKALPLGRALFCYSKRRIDYGS